jgi:hypothetical protein
MVRRRGDFKMRTKIMLAVIGLLTALTPRLLADEQTKKTPAEKADVEWLYPGAKSVSSGVGGAVSCVVQETADDVPKVLKHYDDKLGVGLLGPEAATQSGSVSKGGETTVEYALVNLKPGATGGTATVFTFKTKTAVTTLVVCRPPDGKVTTVTITHVSQNVGK